MDFGLDRRVRIFLVPNSRYQCHMRFSSHFLSNFLPMFSDRLSLSMFRNDEN